MWKIPLQSIACAEAFPRWPDHIAISFYTSHLSTHECTTNAHQHCLPFRDLALCLPTSDRNVHQSILLSKSFWHKGAPLISTVAHNAPMLFQEELSIACNTVFRKDYYFFKIYVFTFYEAAGWHSVYDKNHIAMDSSQTMVDQTSYFHNIFLDH